MKESPGSASFLRFRYLCAAVLLTAVVATAAFAQQGDATKFDDIKTTVARVIESVKHATEEPRLGLSQLYDLIRTEFEQVEGAYLADQIEFVIQRYKSDLTARILWILITLLIASGSIFLVSFGYGILVRPKRVETPKREKVSEFESVRQSLQPSQSPFKRSNIQHREQGTPKSMVGMLKGGRLKDAEELLFEEHRKRPADATVVMYLLACRAAGGDAASYGDLLAKLFPNGLDSSVQICLHAAGIGRAVGLDGYPSNRYPEPDKPFEVDSTVSGNSLGPITEFGDVQTLLDLVRVYVDMGDEAETKHLIVEILVRGDEEQRRQAMTFKNRMGKRGTA